MPAFLCRVNADREGSTALCVALLSSPLLYVHRTAGILVCFIFSLLSSENFVFCDNRILFFIFIIFLYVGSSVIVTNSIQY